jgi:hypothetical protein
MARPGERFRMLIVTAPSECPECHSIRAVIDQDKFRATLERHARQEKERAAGKGPDSPDEPESA